MSKKFAFIFARGGSKGIPNKNIQLLGDIPLIGHSIEVALHSKLFDKIIVSTDSLEIARISESYGAEVPFIRPKELAADTALEIEAWKHAINFYLEKKITFSHFVSLPTTSPLRRVSDIKECINLFDKKKFDIVVTMRPSERSPYFNMVKKDEKGLLSIFSDKQVIGRRQDAKKVYDLTTVAYVSSPNYIMSVDNIFEGNVGGVEIPKERAIDIDDQLDLEIARFLYDSYL